ncbi:NADP-dependent oxidoreductase [Streptomyces sp. NPDC101160]|uniref:NADP-dependent oxidoreductase n=1 Tax=Streptomyces sp. NPDC101160 TaxID=3366118 RepID=UPI00382E1A18
MRALVIDSFGGPEALRIAEVPVPAAGPGQVLIRVEAATVHPVDLATRSGVLAEAGLMAGTGRTGLGWDVAGVVEATGPGVRGVRLGDRVVGMNDRLDVELGTQAEYVVLDAHAVAPAPVSLAPAAAATLPLAGLTALQALDALDLPAGETLLVTGAAGAVGGYAVQLAAARGLRVVAAARPGDDELVRELGAEHVVATGPDAPRLGAAVRSLVPGGVSGALDGAVLGASALDAVRSGGVFAALVAGGAPYPLRGIRVLPVWVRADTADLTRLASLADAGDLTPRVAATLPLTEAPEAHRRLAKGGLRGRVVLVP